MPTDSDVVTMLLVEISLFTRWYDDGIIMFTANAAHHLSCARTLESRNPVQDRCAWLHFVALDRVECQDTHKYGRRRS